MSTTYLIEPKAPLIFSWPGLFGTGAANDVYPFPLPSSLAGAFRTHVGEAEKLDYLDEAAQQRLMAVAIAGPLPVARELTSERLSTLLPRPADALYGECVFNGGGQHWEIARLQPQPLSADGWCDLPEGLWPLLPVLRDKGRRKPHSDEPELWAWSEFARWLTDPAAVTEIEQGVQRPPFERRTHVGIDLATLAHCDEALFQTTGLDFGPRRAAAGWDEYDYGLLIRSDTAVVDGFRKLGGESRLAHIAALSAADDPWPTPSPELEERLRQACRSGGQIRLVLLTPALFSQGWRPGWLDERLEGTPPSAPGLRLRLIAAAIAPWQPISGWDMVARAGDGSNRVTGAPKATRRLVPSGSVYWFEVIAAELTEPPWRDLWLHSLCDREQDRRDGFGLGIVGGWGTSQSGSEPYPA